MVKLQTKQGIGIPHFIMSRFIALQIHCIIYKLKAIPSTGKNIMTLFIAFVWNHTQNISQVCLYYLPSMYMIRAILDNSEQIKTVSEFLCLHVSGIREIPDSPKKVVPPHCYPIENHSFRLCSGVGSEVLRSTWAPTIPTFPTHTMNSRPLTTVPGATYW